MLKLLQKRSTLGRTLVWAAVLALLLSFGGNLQKSFAQIPAADRTVERSIKTVMDTIPAAIKVFRPKPRKDPGSAGWVLTIAETLGSLVTFATVLALLWTVLKEQVEKLRISLLRRHTVVLGLDRRARMFLKSKQRLRARAVVVLDRQASNKTRQRAHAEACLHYATTDEIELPKQLQACRIKRADRLILSTGSDAENLEHAKEIAESGMTLPADVLLMIEDVTLHGQLEENDGFMQGFGTQSQLRLVNGAKGGAVDLLSRTNFTQLAAQQGQEGVTLCVFGATAQAAEVVTQYLRASPSVLPAKPRIVWVVEERDALMRMLSLNYAPLARLIGEPAPGTPLAWAVSIDVVVAGLGAALYDAGVLAQVIARAPQPTACVIAEDPQNYGKTNQQIAIALRQASRRQTALQVPIFAHSEKKGAEDQFFVCRTHAEGQAPVSQKKMAKTEDLSQVIEPFGRSDEVCSWGENETRREALARKLHTQYLRKRAADGGTDTARAASLQPWETLAETYKNANRRAADQLSNLMFCYRHLTQGGAEVTPDDIETLAALEHDAWWIDRELNGWQQAAVRDNARKSHPDLIPYEALSHEIQDYDRAKVRDLIADGLLN